MNIILLRRNISTIDCIDGNDNVNNFSFLLLYFFALPFCNEVIPSVFQLRNSVINVFNVFFKLAEISEIDHIPSF